MRKNGSITVFASLSLMLVAQLLFTLLEGAHCVEVTKCAQMNTDSALESVFADYCTPLWENYHILGAAAEESNGGFSLNEREAQIRTQTRKSLESGKHLLHAQMQDVEFTGYTLLTDQAGKIFEETVCAYMKENLGYEAAKSLFSTYESVQGLKKNWDDSKDSIENARSALQESKKRHATTTIMHRNAAKKRNVGQIYTNKTAKEDKNILDLVAEAKQKGVLSFVLPQGTKLSEKTLSLEQTVSHRKLKKGTQTGKREEDWYQKILLNQYLLEHLSCYTSPREKRALTYELEYLLVGKAKDSDNLKAVVQEMLGIREVLNMVSITAMPQKQAEAMALALTIAGISVNPVIIEAVKYGILAAWAFVESVLDLRTLLAGGRIATIKSELDWTSDLARLPELLSGWSSAKQNVRGMDYKNHLGLLLLFHSGKKLSVRAMDVEEAFVRQIKGYEHFQMDHLLCGAEIEAGYCYDPVFLGFVRLLRTKEDSFQVCVRSRYSCYEK